MEITNIAENFKKRGFGASAFETAAEALDYLNSEIDGVSVAMGGSVTVTQLGLYPLLKTHNEMFWHGDPELVEKLGSREIQRRAINTDVYISSANAVTEDGMIINIDGHGNRIASTCYGHKKLYIIVGKNKIAPDFEKALWRARNIAAPKNAQRLSRNTPCAVKGDKCYDCNSPERICRGFLVFDRALTAIPTEVVIINEELGY